MRAWGFQELWVPLGALLHEDHTEVDIGAPGHRASHLLLYMCIHTDRRRERERATEREREREIYIYIYMYMQIEAGWRRDKSILVILTPELGPYS